MLTLQGFTQEFNLVFNSRNPKADTVIFDWYFAGELKIPIDSVIQLSLFGNIERDNGTIYHSYKVKADNKYFSVMYFYDTEKDIDMYSFAYFLTFKMFKFGADFIYIDSLSPNIYLAFDYKFIDFKISFADQISKLEFDLKPNFKIGKKDKIKLGYTINGILIEDSWKWNAGFKATIYLKK